MNKVREGYALKMKARLDSTNQGRRAHVSRVRMEKIRQKALDGLLTTSEMAALAGVSKRQVQFWSEQGYICPEMQKAHGGGGIARRFNPQETIRVQAFASLRARGVPCSKADLLVRMQSAADVEAICAAVDTLRKFNL